MEIGSEYHHTASALMYMDGSGPYDVKKLPIDSGLYYFRDDIIINGVQVDASSVVTFNSFSFSMTFSNLIHKYFDAVFVSVLPHIHQFSWDIFFPQLESHKAPEMITNQKYIFPLGPTTGIFSSSLSHLSSYILFMNQSHGWWVHHLHAPHPPSPILQSSLAKSLFWKPTQHDCFLEQEPFQ